MNDKNPVQGTPQIQSGDTEISYRRCLCTYVDVLGFRALVERSKNDADTRKRISFILRQFRESYNSKPISGELVLTEPHMIRRNFSDLIVRIVPLSDKKRKDGSIEPLNILSEIVHEGIDLCGAQFSLLEQGILVRGGITIGELNWEDEQLFGPGLVRAYELERDLAYYPRIVIDSEVLRELQRSAETPVSALWKNYFRQDFDGMWFADYLNFYISFSQPNIVFNREGFRIPFENIRRFLVKQLKNETEINSRRAKYRWLINYFNSLVQSAPPDSGVNWAELLIQL